MTNEKKYLIDGRPVTPMELINEAEANGYVSEDGLLTTSEAARYLRQQGYEVSENTEPKRC